LTKGQLGRIIAPCYETIRNESFKQK
jgi:hypothetical protein